MNIMKIVNISSLSNYYLRSLGAYWGRAAAGILFICSEDGTMLLTLRSPHVMQPGTWGIPGGAVSIDGEDADETTLTGAKREVIEELGSLPNNMKEIANTIFRDGGFTYSTYVFDISLKDKMNWAGRISLNWENDSADWFNMEELPSPLHFGVRSLSGLLKQQDINIFDVEGEDDKNDDENDEEALNL